MAIFKCKMCGGTIEFQDGATVGVCDSCGTKQTLPRLDSDRKTNLYDRANHFRRNNEFDKAMSIYENILNEDPTDAEAYWSLVLCRYGIEYVEDPATHKRLPTVNRAQFTSIFDDEDYKSALKNADALQRAIYEDEAKVINEIQKGILEISSKEEPFDVFICYKETDANGRRTPDSVLATDLYHQLTNEGFKVFFSRITLEDKLGQEYEPYIFAALNSAKAMVVLGTRPEHFNAVWVKNEWSRYLALIKAGAKKTLIPAYRDMDPYDLPEEFSHLQAQDMSKLGFMQDLIRGIKKIVKTDEPKPIIKETVVTPAATAATAPLLRRAFMFLEDGEWQSADEYCEKVLDVEPENAEAYLGKLMAELHVKNRDDLKKQPQPFDDRNNYKKAVRFGDEKLKAELTGDIAFIKDRNEEARKAGIYQRALDAFIASKTESEYLAAADEFEQIPNYKDSEQKHKEACQRAEEARVEAERQAEIRRKNDIRAKAYAAAAVNSVGSQEEAIRLFRKIPGWRDADEQIVICEKKITEIKERQQAARLELQREAEEHRATAKKRKRTFAIVTPILVACIAFVIVLTTVIIPNQKYNAAVELYNTGKYEDAIEAFTALNGHKDSAAQIEKCETAIKDEKYASAVELYTAGKYEEAIAAFTALDGYKDSAAQIKGIKQQLLSVGSTVFFGSYEQDNNTANGKEDIEWIVLAKEGNKVLVISKYALDCQKYYSTFTDVTWETCSLRKWLNGTFLNAAFSSEEQNRIISTTVTADRNPSCSTSPGNNTTDKVFLLSITEANKYFSSDEARKCAPTDYAIAQGAYARSSYTTGGRATCCWWLRSPGCNTTYAADVYFGGSVCYYGDSVSYDNDAVRPALWIDLGGN